MITKIEKREVGVAFFAQRLVDTLVDKGYTSSRTKVNARELADAIGCSYQMARKYVVGVALPEFETIQKIAIWLDVSAGWLLFGETEHVDRNDKDERLNLNLDIVRHIINKILPLYANCGNLDEVVDFAVDVFYDASHINADKTTILKCIDMAIDSVERFSKQNNDRRKSFG